MTREEAIQCIKHELLITVNRKDLTGQAIGEALDMAIKALQGDMYCPSCGVRLVPENEYVEPKPFKEGDSE